MLTRMCRSRQGPENPDKFPKTRDNRRSRAKCEDQDTLIGMIDGWAGHFTIQGKRPWTTI